jgi:predicted transposase YdaD
MSGGEYDLFTKSIIRESGKDVVTWLTGLTPLEVEPVRTELVVAEARLSDEILRVRLPGNPQGRFFLHIEAQTAGDPDMPRRMREYWTRAERILLEQAKRDEKEEEVVEVRLSSFVIYLNRRRYIHDPGETSYADDLGTECLFRYRVIRVWELDPRTVYRLTYPGLVPLAPLMKTADPVKTMVESEEIIRAWNPELVSDQRKANLRLALAVYSGMVIEDLNMVSELLKVDREWLEQSVLVQEWLRQGREQGIEQGIEKGLILARREDLLSVLNSRFGAVDASLEAAVLRIEDPQRLRDLVARAVVVQSLEEFARELAS